MNSSSDVDLCVMGAGPVGAALACWLARRGMATMLVDHAPLPPMEHPAFDGRAYAIAAGSVPLLEEAGIWAQLPIPPSPIRHIKVTDGKPGRRASPLSLRFDLPETDQGAMGWMVEARSLRIAINRQIQALPNLTLHAPTTARVTRTPDSALVRLADGREISCRLVVAADGRASQLRQQAGIPTTSWSYGQLAIVCALAHQRPHGNQALEHFLPAGPFAQLPMGPVDGHPHVSAIVWADRPEMVEAAMALDDVDFAQAVQLRLGGHLGELRLLGRRWSYPLSALLAHRLVDTRLALAGDSAHGIHPIAGQGLNLGFRDATELAHLLDGAPDPGAPELLARYQRARRPDNLRMLAATDVLERLFSNDIPRLRLARDLGIAAVNHIPPLKRRFMAMAMGE